MPLISHFFGILIYLYCENKEKHNTPHIHAKYAEYESSFDLDGEQIVGNLPKKQAKLVEAWILQYSEELKADWKLFNETGEYYKIRGWE